MQIYMIRHCEATGQSEDAPLTANGYQQAESLAEFLAKTGVDQVVCSPYLRARQSIEPYVLRNNIPILLDGRLSERVLSSSNMDDWFERLRQTFDNLDLSFDGGESSRQAMERAVAVVKTVESTESKCTAIVTHGNLMTLLLKYFDEQFGFDEWTKLTNPDVFLIEIGDLSSTVKRVWR